jgi:hypothetical protein
VRRNREQGGRESEVVEGGSEWEEGLRGRWDAGKERVRSKREQGERGSEGKEGARGKREQGEKRERGERWSKGKEGVREARGSEGKEGARKKGARGAISEINYTEEEMKGMIERKKEKIDARQGKKERGVEAGEKEAEGARGRKGERLLKKGREEMYLLIYTVLQGAPVGGGGSQRDVVYLG